MNFFDNHKIEIGEKLETPFMNKFDVYQDGTTPMYRDVDGKLWAISGHSNQGRIAMFCGTSFDDMKMTPYFETRCNNLVNKVYVCKTGAELVELLAKSCGVSMSSYFRYRDILDIVKEKKNTMEFSENDSEILGYIIKSLELNHVIAPKIKAIYALLNGDACVGDE